jgi:hypothetical protein
VVTQANREQLPGTELDLLDYWAIDLGSHIHTLMASLTVEGPAISNARIVVMSTCARSPGTLVLLNAAYPVLVYASSSFQPAVLLPFV